MKFSAAKTDILAAKVELIAVSMHDGKIQKNSSLEKINKMLGGEINDIITNEKIKGTPGQAKLIYTKGRMNSSYILILGLGDKKKFSMEVLRKCGAVLNSVACQIAATEIVSDIHGLGLGKFSLDECVQSLCEGFFLGSYSFDRYKKGDASPVKKVSLICSDATKVARADKAIGDARAIATAVNMARDMINTPASDMTPETLAKQALALQGIKTRVHDLAAIKKMKMGSFLSVGLGSTQNPPRFIEMHYTPRGKARKKIAIIGKGVTFDTGGYSIKPAKAMETMKDDMSGAAAVIAIMSLLPQLKPDVAVSGYIAATENMVDGCAQRPGDICTAMNGTTIEVLNTDAEGRLTLADALVYAIKNKPDYVIDMATLTGACLVALGMLYAGIMGNDDKLIAKLVECGKYSGENIWPLPLPEEYKEDLKSPIADLKNIGGAYAGTLTAGLFLEHFVGDAKWAHIDIAGPAWTEKPLAYSPRGGTGIMVRTITRFLQQI